MKHTSSAEDCMHLLPFTTRWSATSISIEKSTKNGTLTTASELLMSVEMLFYTN